MQALLLTSKDTLEYRADIPEPGPSGEEELVDIRAAALNHRDVWITQGLYPGIIWPVILGSDGAGYWQGREVVINPSIGWGENPIFQAKSYHILGLPKNGTLAEWVSVPQQQIYDKPSHLSMEEAAALPLAGLTAYRAVFTKGAVKAGEQVLVTGIGGGVALFAMQFAMAAGAKVYVTSGYDEKIEKACALGAQGGANYKQVDWAKKMYQEAGGFDLVFDGAGGDGLLHIMKICNPGARIVVYGGGVSGAPDFKTQPIFWKQLSLLGTSMGTDAEFASMLDLVAKHHIKPVVDSVFSFKDGLAAFERMAKGRQFGKIILVP